MHVHSDTDGLPNQTGYALEQLLRQLDGGKLAAGYLRRGLGQRSALRRYHGSPPLRQG